MAKRRGEASHDQDRLIHFVEGYDIQLGAGAATYLVGMGDFKDVTGVEHYLAATEPGPDGHFGLIDDRTHREYETKIAPAVSVNRVLSDIVVTEDRHKDFRMPPGVLPNPPAQPAPAARPAQPGGAQPHAQAQAPVARGRGRGRGRRGARTRRLAAEEQAEQPVDAIGGVQDSDDDDDGEDPKEINGKDKA